MRGYARNSLPLALGWFFVFATLLFGQGMGIAFGAVEDDIKAGLSARGEAVLSEVYQGDRGALEAVSKKAWSYYKRAHLHAGGMGTTAAVLLGLLGLLVGQDRLRGAVALALGAGAFGYSFFWYLAGRAAPALGSTGAAKEAYANLARMSSGFYVAATVWVAVILGLTLWRAWREGQAAAPKG